MAEKETNPLVLNKLEQWQDARFGLMMHWGTYSQWGACESWPICSEPWIDRDMDNYEEYKKAYTNLKNTFNPVDFDPDKWAKWAEDAGMKYVVFTTKHHDGFAMYDTKFSDYKITDPGCPFSSNKRSDITKEIFEAFRKRDFMIGAYFSKPDWHNEHYWSPYWATPDRHPNYDPDEKPELWKKFRDFTHNQIEELVRDYGPLDIIWFDGAWVAPKLEEGVDYLGNPIKNQDLDMDALAEMMRSYTEDLIIVDRWVAGPHENYLTPERSIPEKPLEGPWETCMPMAGAWSYYPNDNYKSTKELIRQLVDVVSKGGNYLLNVGVDGQGNFPDDAINQLEEIGKWMAVNGEAIHGSRKIAPYQDGKCRLTQGKDGSIYAIYVSDDDENSPPNHILLKSLTLDENSVLTLLGYDGHIEWKRVGSGIQIEIPETFIAASANEHAWVVNISNI